MNSIDKFWINCFFNCNESDYFNNNNIVCKHSYLKNYNGFFVLNVRNKFIISAPKDYVESIRNVIEKNMNYFDSDVWKTILNNHFDTIVGPAWIGYCNKIENYKLDPSCRKLNLEDEIDRQNLDKFRRACDVTEWEHSAISMDSEVIIVKYIGSEIVSATSYKLWGDDIAHIGIITHPLYRGNGYAKNVLMALTLYGINKGLVMQFRTLSSNTSAIKVAIACNYDFFGEHISVRLR